MPKVSLKRFMTIAAIASLLLVGTLFLVPSHTAKAATLQKLSLSEVSCTKNTSKITLKTQEYTDAPGPWHCYTGRGSFKPAYELGTVCAISYDAKVYGENNGGGGSSVPFKVTVKAGTCNDTFDPNDGDYIGKISNQ
jgi:hypothetical protein